MATSRWRGGFAGSNHPDLDALPIVFTSTFSWIWFCRIRQGYHNFNSLIITAVVLFALSLVPGPRGGLGVGFYFGGFSLGMTFDSVVFVAPQVVPAGITAIVGAIPYGIAALHAFLLASVCVLARDRLK